MKIMRVYPEWQDIIEPLGKKKKLKVLELFSGTASFSNAAKERGHDVLTVDNDEKFTPDICADVIDLDLRIHSYYPDIIWASPPCTCFSVASIGTHWTGGKNAYVPKTVNAFKSIALVTRTVEIIEELKPTYFFIENPRGVLRKLDLIPYPVKTCCYCQYGDTRMKPTDIWTNLDAWVPKMCHNGNPDHEEARRGAKTGTQGLKGSIDRSRVPKALCNDLLDLIEGF
jgi:hypothetical protein